MYMQDHAVFTYLFVRSYICRREGSKDILTGKANGTFLVRPKQNAPASTTDPVHCHTIDIM